MRLVPLTDSVQALWKVYVAARQGEIEEWDFSRVRSECARVRDIGTPEEREFVDRVLAEVTRLEEVQELFLRRPPVRTAGTVERIPRRDVDEPMAVGWVVGRGRHISMEGTHALTRGDRVLYYLRGEGIDLDSCVNRLVAVLSGTVEELPARYGCDLIRVSRVKVLTP